VGVRVLHSFPHKIGAGRICTTAWWEVACAARAGCELTLYAGVVQRPLPASVRTRTTLARGRWRIPYGALGTDRALVLHDRIVARALPRLAGEIDVVHTWPLGGLRTLRAARRLGITTVIERPNAHTRFAYQAVARECERLGVALPADQEHAYNASRLSKEEEEYGLADYLLCPSEFVARTFREQGFAPERLLRHSYGYDESVYHPAVGPADPAVGPADPAVVSTAGERAGRAGSETQAVAPAAGESEQEPTGLNALFVGVCAVRKGLHFALRAWLRSPASRAGTFRIAGEFLPGYEERLAPMLAHPSVQVLGHRDDVPQLMRSSDVLLLPTLEEGSPLVCMEAVGSGCVPLVSEVCDAVCIADNALAHPVGDVEELARHLTLLASDRARLAAMRAACLALAPTLTWAAAGQRLLAVYEQAAASGPAQSRPLHRVA